MKISIFKLFAVVNFIHQKYFYSISAGLVTFLLSIFVPGQLWATPEAAVDFSQTNATVEIDRTDTSNPNILSAVSSVCPEDGFVVAIANGGLRFSTVPLASGITRGAVVISLSRGSIRFDEDHELAVSGDFVDIEFTGPVSIQRADRCRMGNSITYRFLAATSINVEDASMKQPSLIVMFFRDPF
jgi:hypothetical protein